MDWISSLNTLMPSLIGRFNAKQDSRQATAEARQWEEDMYNKYNSPSALVRQYQEAGINPALMFGGQLPAAPTQTEAAPMPESATGSLTDMIAQQLNLEILEYDKELKKSQVDDYRSQVARREYQNALDAAQTNSVLKNTEWIDRLNSAKESADLARAKLDFAEAAIAEEEKRLGHRLGSSEALAIISAITSALGIKPDDKGFIHGLGSQIGRWLADDGEKLSLAEAFGGPVVHAIVEEWKKAKGK